MTDKTYNTPKLDELESGPWPSFVTGLKRLAEDKPMIAGVLGQLEHSYTDRKGYWKGGTIGVYGYGGGIIPRFTELKDDDSNPIYPEAQEFHTMRFIPPAGMHYSTELLRDICDIWEKHGSGLIALHGQTGDIMLQGITADNVQACFDELNAYGLDLGGAGPAVRTGMSCVGAARCEHSCCNEQKIHRLLVNNFLDDMHRPSLPYKFKFKVSGCANDCMNSIERSDFAVIGTWRDDIQVDQAEVQAFVETKGRKHTIDNVVSRCPSGSLSLNDDNTLEIDNASCVRCMHCINVMTRALAPGQDRGVTILVGGKRTLRIGDLFGTVVVPFLPLRSDADYQRILEIAQEIVDFFAENALEHERVGEMIERIGLVNFLEAVGLEVDPNMIHEPRSISYVRTDDWDEEAEKWYRRQHMQSEQAS
ncbi:MAG: dissimilatory-type sulfite reductase subunit alpha [Halorhodospira halophila]|uniref:dissimilatory-type sulfite reductase subunit alpha n=1 Tax=Halorhodospira TaxID=85108 RepID=UPI001EE7D3F1|nr:MULTISPECIES: dissimilatory-type sulfite reductase subunit alpha [Halorhodospira]MCC3750054.1 dissimilatory-type sulfite reductase subunit alpha [Halorhodospira halophila]MCG5527616.1 dissimilatory-type sulfite reductase subunit alpha [Halorhodospira halophila]MCG5532635.1 dissimilatory-type sulfite reductase subunit alpha [Halorhodospira sp. 9621]MCG5544198.1 dissimilatory-type sulfite reductase subunit alpha [Halorhodospira sp. 9628]